MQYFVGRQLCRTQNALGADDQGADWASGKVGSGIETDELVVVKYIC